MPTIIRDQPASTETRATLKAENRPVLVAFSGGKDSIAAELALQDAGIETHLAYLYYIPGKTPGKTLDFVEQGLEDLSQKLGKQIHRYPHPSLYRWLNNFVFQTPERCEIIEAAGLPKITFEQIWGAIKDDLGLAPDTWVADGVRAADSIVRRASFIRHGVMKPNSHKVSPIADWLKGEVMARIGQADIQLPIDYEWFKRSFDGLDYRFLKPIHDNAPEDFAQILEWFPLADLGLFRHELQE
jgi:3'-phosphoadenosine 5'-phosphosulfate sulfotransferase (PAPS reductase)/FAD synthetase